MFSSELSQKETVKPLWCFCVSVIESCLMTMSNIHDKLQLDFNKKKTQSIINLYEVFDKGGFNLIYDVIVLL